MKTMKDFWMTIRSRWQNHMPVFFRRMMWLAGLVSGTAIAVHEAFVQLGIEPHEWWIDIERYLIGGGAGVAFACKFTQTYGKDGEPIRKGLEPTQPSSVNNSDIETTAPDAQDDMPDDIEPYNEHID